MYILSKILKNVLFCTFLLVNVVPLFGQQASVSTTVRPPYNAYLDQFKNQITVNVANTSNSPLTGAFLRLYIEGDNGIVIQSKDEFEYLDAFDINEMMTTRLGISGHFDNAFALENLIISGITADELYSKGLPLGNYSLCFRLYNNDFEPISFEAPSGCAMFNNSVEPPQLILPYCGDDIVSGSNNLIFSWTMPPGASIATTQYTLKMVELLPNQDPNQAFLSATAPAFFERTVTAQTSILYGPTDPPLESGKSYAWQIIANDDELNTPFLNNGRSEVCWFTWKPNNPTGVVLGALPTDDETPKQNSPIFTKDLTPRPLHLNTFKGKVLYAFRATEKGTIPATVARGEIASTEVRSTINLSPNISAPSTSGNLGIGNNIGFVQSSGTTQVFNMFLSDQEKGQNDINKIIGGTKFPLVDSKVELYMYIDEFNFDINSSSFGQKSERKILIGNGVTDANGDFSITYYGDLKIGKELDLIINNKHFQFSSYRIPINKTFDGTYDMGSLIGVAKTFRLKLKAEDYDNNELDDVNFKIYRVSNFYNNGALNKNLKYEGNREKSPQTYTNSKQVFRNKNLELVAEGNSKIIYSRLFFALNLGEYYIIKSFVNSKVVKEEKYLGFVNTHKDYTKESVLLFEKTIKILLPNPVIEGRVLIKNSNGIAAAGAKIFIKSTKPSSSGLTSFLKTSAIADESGYFKLENIPAQKDAYKIQIRYQKAKFNPDLNISLDKRGMSQDLGNIEIEGHLEQVCGKMVDEAGNAMSNVILKWKNGQDIFESDTDGNFTTSQTPGNHILTAKAAGYRDKAFTIKVGNPEPSSIQLTADTANFNAVSASNSNIINASPSYQTIGMSQAGTYENGVTYTQASAIKVFGKGSVFNSNLQVDNCNNTLKMSRFYVKVTITDTNNNPIKKARAKSEWGNSETANNKGVVVLKNIPMGVSNLTISGALNDSFLAISTPIEINNSIKKDTLELQFSLEKGIGISGRVKSGSTNLGEAKIYLKGKTHINTVSDSNGKYSLAVPEGNFEIVGSKSGYISEKKIDNFEKGKTYSIDFNLEKPAFNAEKLMGYNLLVSNYTKTNNADEFKISGQITDVLFSSGMKSKGTINFAFHDVLIRKKGNTIEPVSNHVNLDLSNIELLMFDYLSAQAYNANGFELQPINGDNQKGKIVSPVKIDLKKSFPNISGLSFTNKPLFLKTNNTKNIEISRSEISSTSINYKIDEDNVTWKLYGFEVKPNFSNASISENGIDLAALLKIDAVSGINPVSVNIKKLTISNSGILKKVDISSNFDIDISQWKLKISNISINSYGISLAGNMDATIPGSPKASIGVSDLLIKTTGIAGGKFYFPNAGLSIYDAVKIKSNQPFALQKVPASSNYQLAGGALLQLPKYISKNIDLPFFSIATNGNFGFKIKPDLDLNFADMASFKIKNIGFKSASKTLDIGGKMKLDIPNLGIGAESNLHYSKSSVSVDEIGIAYNLASAIAIDAKVKFTGNEFAGGGSLKLADMDAGIGLDFHYKKLSNGKDIGATFKTGFVIPIGVVKMDQLGGGFNVNTATDRYSIFADGRITFAADPSGVVALNPVKVKITSTPKGPIFDGSANLVLMNSWKVGDASFKLDFADQYYYIDASMGTGVKLVKGVSFSGTGGLHLELSTKSNNSYWFVSAYAKASIAKIFNSGITMVGGWNVSKSQHTSLSNVPNYMLHNGKIYGGYFNAHASLSSSVKLGVKGIATVSGSLYNKSNVTVFANIKGNSYGAKFENGFGGSFSADFFDIGIASASLTVNSGFDGYYKSGNWSINGNLAANLNAHIGCNGGCNGITWGGCFDPCFWSSCRVCPIPCGAKICVSPNVNVGYNSNNGVTFKLNL